MRLYIGLGGEGGGGQGRNYLPPEGLLFHKIKPVCIVGYVTSFLQILFLGEYWP